MTCKFKGFTLIEIIISIVILSFVSAVLLRLFITADNLNTSANDKSIASVMAANAIESFDGNIQPYTIYYDEDWQTVTAQDDWFYTLQFSTTQDELATLYNIKTIILDRQGKELLAYKTSRFFKGGDM